MMVSETDCWVVCPVSLSVHDTKYNKDWRNDSRKCLPLDIALTFHLDLFPPNDVSASFLQLCLQERDKRKEGKVPCLSWQSSQLQRKSLHLILCPREPSFLSWNQCTVKNVLRSSDLCHTSILALCPSWREVREENRQFVHRQQTQHMEVSLSLSHVLCILLYIIILHSEERERPDVKYKACFFDSLLCWFNHYFLVHNKRKGFSFSLLLLLLSLHFLFGETLFFKTSSLLRLLSTSVVQSVMFCCCYACCRSETAFSANSVCFFPFIVLWLNWCPAWGEKLSCWVKRGNWSRRSHSKSPPSDVIASHEKRGVFFNEMRWHKWLKSLSLTSSLAKK